MQVGVERRDNTTILHLRGEFDTFVCKPLLEKVDSLIDVGDRDVVMNLRLVKFMNSTALGTTLKISKTLKEEGGKLVLSNPSEFCLKVLKTVGLDRVLPIYANDDEAIANLRSEKKPGDGEPVDLLGEENSGMLFTPVDEAHMAKFFPEENRPQATNPLHGHAFGRNWKGVGRVSHLDEDRLDFTWDGGNLGLTKAQMNEMLAPGIELQVKFRLPLLQWTLSEAIVAVDKTEDAEEGVKVSTSFAEIEAKVLKAVRQYSQDMTYLKDELRDVDRGERDASA